MCLSRGSRRLLGKRVSFTHDVSSAPVAAGSIHHDVGYVVHDPDKLINEIFNLLSAPLATLVVKLNIKLLTPPAGKASLVYLQCALSKQEKPQSLAGDLRVM